MGGHYKPSLNGTIILGFTNDHIDVFFQILVRVRLVSRNPFASGVFSLLIISLMIRPSIQTEEP